ncbi:MAG: ATP-dependent DNA helicase RecG [Acidobacteria bacterium]|nr:ATP-dependent DNA helicase RecG [Acidobacteriota bacterium]
MKTPLNQLHLHGVKGVGFSVARKLAAAVADEQAEASIERMTVEDLLYHLPARYEDRSRMVRIRELAEGMAASILATVRVSGGYFVKRGRLRIFEISATDGTGQVRAYWWNQPWREKTLKPGAEVILYGLWKWNRGKRCFEVQGAETEVIPEAEAGAEPIHTGRHVPVYHKLGVFRTRWLRSVMHHVLESLPPISVVENLPPATIRRHQLAPRGVALRRAHFPAEDADLDEYNARRAPSQRRLIFEEFFWLQMALALRRQDRQAAPKGPRFEVDDRIRGIARTIMPFTLTGDQRTALRAIVSDMTSDHPMHRLLQGDVGSGKTIVALLAAVVAIENGYQAALMAPTEILAEQHARNVIRLLQKTPYRVMSLVGGPRTRARAQALAAMAAGEIDLIIGTHALIQEGVEFHKLGLVIIDEQHRFGVLQRAQLMQQGRYPDVLVMTATPIPRSLAMTLYGDLDVSVIREMPPGRIPVQTAVRFEEAREKVYRFVREEARAGRQIYIVYPLVEDSEKLDLRNATEAAESLQRHTFPEFKLDLLHGRKKPAEKEAVMQRFLAGEIQILVSTTVIEVGVDVSNASVMIIEHAERFGLAQLHQLRGRVGRGSARAYCILMSERNRTEEAAARLDIMVRSNDGFEISERDLELRGPGELLGTRQSGIPVLRLAHLVRDQDLLQLAREEVERICHGRWKSPEVNRLAAMVRSHSRYGLAMVG